jgi:UDP-glucose 4-epimerase
MRPAPISPYAISKYTGELYCRAFHRLYGLPVVILRYFNVFGEGQQADSEYAAVIPRFLACLEAGRPATVYGDGEQTRDFTYVQNVVDANLLACSAFDVEGETFNIGCGLEVSVNDLVALIEEAKGSCLDVTYAETRPADVLRSVACIEKARLRLGYEPHVEVLEGLRRMVKASESLSCFGTREFRD